MDDLEEKLPALVESFATEIREDLDRIGPWPGTEIVSQASGLSQAISQTEQLTADNIAETVQASLRLTRAARLFTRTLRIEVIKLVDEVLNALGTASNNRELSTVITLRERIGAAGPLIERDPPYRKLVTLIRELRDALANLVRAKAPANTKTVEDALETGEFLVAAKAAKASQPVKPKVETYGGHRRPEGEKDQPSSFRETLHCQLTDCRPCRRFESSHLPMFASVRQSTCEL